MNIAIVFSPDWSQYVAIELFSLFSTNSASIKVYLVSEGPAQIDFSRLCRPGYDVAYIDLATRFKERIPSVINANTPFTKYVLYRLLLPEVISDDQLLYLDADIIVNGDISELFNANMDGFLIAGVTDTGMGSGSMDWHQKRLRAIGFPPGAAYINAGVTLFNLAAIRESGLNETWIRLANDVPYAAPDQDIMNLTCQGKIKLVENKYNVSISTGLDVDDIRIAHFACPAKPWKDSGVPNYHLWKKWSDAYMESVVKKEEISVTNNPYKTLSKEAIHPEVFMSNCTEDQRARLTQTHLKQLLDGYRVRSFENTLGTVIDYGCGDGRISRFMAEKCSSLLCIDINEAVLEAAKANVKISNVEYHLSEQLHVFNIADFIYSFQVMQHNTTEDQIAILFHIYALLKENGVACIHFPRIEDKPSYVKCTSTCMCFTKDQVDRYGKLFPYYEVEDAEFGDNWFDYYLWVRK